MNFSGDKVHFAIFEDNSLSDNSFHPNWFTLFSDLNNQRSLTEYSLGSILIPPFAPPNGTSTTAHLNVINMAKAFTSSLSTSGLYRIPVEATRKLLFKFIKNKQNIAQKNRLFLPYFVC